MNRKELESRQRLTKIKESEQASDTTPLKNHLNVQQIESGTYVDYIKRIKERRTKESSPQNSDNTSGKPKL